MSIVLPIPNYVRKFYVINFSKTTGIVAGTPFELFDLENVEIMYILIYQSNTTPQANNMDFILTIDGETIRADNAGINNNTIYYLYTEPSGVSPAIGENPFISITLNPVRFGIVGYDVAAGAQEDGQNLMGHSLRLQVNFDTIGTAQEFHADVWYLKKEAT